MENLKEAKTKLEKESKKGKFPASEIDNKLNQWKEEQEFKKGNIIITNNFNIF